MTRHKILPVTPLQRVCSLELEGRVYQVASRAHSTSSCPKNPDRAGPDGSPGENFPDPSRPIGTTIWSFGSSQGTTSVDHTWMDPLSMYLSLLSYSKLAHGISLDFLIPNTKNHPHGGGPVRDDWGGPSQEMMHTKRYVSWKDENR